MQVLTREKCFRGNSTPLDRLAMVLNENLIKNFEKNFRCRKIAYRVWKTKFYQKNRFFTGIHAFSRAQRACSAPN
jgi:hypothetical protein